MTDRELLEAAARAASLEYRWRNAPEICIGEGIDEANYPTLLWKQWDPLTDDGDALRLAAKLRIQICFSDPDDEEYAWCLIPQTNSEVDDACYRRAIVRAAAEIGRARE